MISETLLWERPIDGYPFIARCILKRDEVDSVVMTGRSVQQGLRWWKYAAVILPKGSSGQYLLACQDAALEALKLKWDDQFLRPGCTS